MQVQDSCFKDIVGKKVKVVYSDIGKESFARGILEKEDSKFLYIRGDKSFQVISKDMLLKLNCVSSQDGKAGIQV